MRKMMWRCKTSCSTDWISNNSITDLIKEIETLPVVGQSNHVKTLALMSAKQERDDLFGLAAVCDLTVKCTCPE